MLKLAVGRLSYGLGLLSLLHSGYSAVEHLAFEKSLGRNAEQHLPNDIIIQVLVSLVLCVIGISIVSGDVRPYSLQSVKRSMDSIDDLAAFRPAVHRAKYLF